MNSFTVELCFVLYADRASDTAAADLITAIHFGLDHERLDLIGWIQASDEPAHEDLTLFVSSIGVAKDAILVDAEVSNQVFALVGEFNSGDEGAEKLLEATIVMIRAKRIGCALIASGINQPFDLEEGVPDGITFDAEGSARRQLVMLFQLAYDGKALALTYEDRPEGEPQSEVIVISVEKIGRGDRDN